MTGSFSLQNSPTQIPSAYAFFSHFVRKDFFAAPLSGFPLLSTAFGSHASFLHFCTKLFFAAPASSLPSEPTALLSHVSGQTRKRRRRSSGTQRGELFISRSPLHKVTTIRAGPYNRSLPTAIVLSARPPWPRAVKPVRPRSPGAGQGPRIRGPPQTTHPPNTATTSNRPSRRHLASLRPTRSRDRRSASPEPV